MKSALPVYLTGCLLFSFGAKCFIDSDMGTDPLDVLVLGIVKHTGLTIGIVSGLIAVFFLAVWSLWNRQRPPITPFVTMFLVGSLIDLWNYLRLESFLLPVFSSYALLGIGLVIAAFASSLIIMSGIGIRTMDLVAITMVHKWRTTFFTAKMSIEIAFIVSGYLLGGPVGIGSVAFVTLVGPGIIAFLWINEKVIGMTNYGFLIGSEQATAKSG